MYIMYIFDHCCDVRLWNTSRCENWYRWERYDGRYI